MHFEGPPPGAVTPDCRDDAIYTVTEIYPEHVVLDGNHPLAGIALRLALDGARRARGDRGRDRSRQGRQQRPGFLPVCRPARACTERQPASAVRRRGARGGYSADAATAAGGATPAPGPDPRR